MDFRSGKTDIMQIQKLLTGFCVGLPSDSKIEFGPKNYKNHERNAVGMKSLAAAFFDNSKEINADEINDKFHNDIPMMLEEEKVLKAFSQARDMYIYTNRRFIIVDTKGVSGQRVKYKTIPVSPSAIFKIWTMNYEFDVSHSRFDSSCSVQTH